ncbi:uncharacterized protein PSFLO_07087 [Pseudozyma flocculosa]|uniref:Uncharacterized protein n=1 Tax=Pseudozyma flocculosa TaxID=84751 RepID=A0A5C3FD46_9BASI|nr:uncharacterized protein PSFLO_07087 [Pseudozyma flocculosa]
MPCLLLAACCLLLASALLAWPRPDGGDPRIGDQPAQRSHAVQQRRAARRRSSNRRLARESPPARQPASQPASKVGPRPSRPSRIVRTSSPSIAMTLSPSGAGQS